MLQIEEANSLMTTFLQLRSRAKKTKSKEDINKFKKHEQLCIEKFKYIVLTKTSRYKSFSNYDDLMQEGLVALLSAMHSFNPRKKSNIFWWIHRYTDTRIARCANLHTTIRFPLKYAKKVMPHREAILPTLIDQSYGPHDILESREASKLIIDNFDTLSANQQKVIKMLFGMDDGNPKSVSKVCKNLNMSRPHCIKIINQVFTTLRRNIRI